MVTLAQRITELRTQRGLSRPELSAALGLPKNAAEKFETGRQTPTQEQQTRMAQFFEVSLFYLRGESNDPTRQETWMNGNFQDDEEPAPTPRRKPTPPPRPAGEDSPMMGSFLKSPAFQETVRTAVLDVLRSPEGQDILARAIRRQLEGRK